MKDLQDQETDIPLNAGITNLQVLFHSQVRDWKFPVTLELSIPITKRGAHMSRLVADKVEAGDYVETILDSLAKRVYKSCGVYPVIRANFVYPWRDQFANVIVARSPIDVIVQELSIIGITACPCSKEMMGIGHMQRCTLTVKLVYRSSKECKLFEDTLEKMETCFSTTLKEKLKRPDEAEAIRLSQANPMFVEDVVRKAVRIFDDSLYEVVAQSHESIHAHDAYAKWINKKYTGEVREL